jgi:hypothetical protein
MLLMGNALRSSRGLSVASEACMQRIGKVLGMLC